VCRFGDVNRRRGVLDPAAIAAPAAEDWRRAVGVVTLPPSTRTIRAIEWSTRSAMHRGSNNCPQIRNAKCLEFAKLRVAKPTDAAQAERDFGSAHWACVGQKRLTLRASHRRGVTGIRYS
jgi:hypothetical protein